MRNIRSSRIALVAMCSIVLVLASPSTDAQDGFDADWVFANGLVHIGDGKPATVGHVAIRDGSIVAVGDFDFGQIKTIVDCKGLVICPGFIDLHNHSDEKLHRNVTRSALNYVTQGCTTMVTGNCGSGPLDVAAFYETLEEHGIGLNVAHLIPQGSLRREVIGTEKRDATSDELANMQQLAEKGMQDGAWGMSSGLIYVPSSYADQEELSAVSRAVARHGGIYVSHIRGEGLGLLDSVREALAIGRDAGCPVHISHFKSSGKDSWGLVRTAIEIINEARNVGQIVTADQYPYTASSTSLSATFIPAWARAGGRKLMLSRIEDAGADQARIVEAINSKLVQTDGGMRIQIAYCDAHPEWAGKRLQEIADELGISAFDLIIQIEKEGGASIVNHSINEEDVRYVMQQPWVATASDGSARVPSDEVPHPRSYGTFSRKLGHYSAREQVIPLEKAIRSCSGLPADILGMQDRGYLRVGLAADIVVFDPEQIIDTATFVKPHQYSNGVEHVFINGTPTIFESRPTGALPGKVLRHPAH